MENNELMDDGLRIRRPFLDKSMELEIYERPNSTVKAKARAAKAVGRGY